MSERGLLRWMATLVVGAIVLIGVILWSLSR